MTGTSITVNSGVAARSMQPLTSLRGSLQAAQQDELNTPDTGVHNGFVFPATHNGFLPSIEALPTPTLESHMCWGISPADTPNRAGGDPLLTQSTPSPPKRPQDLTLAVNVRHLAPGYPKTPQGLLGGGVDTPLQGLDTMNTPDVIEFLDSNGEFNLIRYMEPSREEPVHKIAVPTNRDQAFFETSPPSFHDNPNSGEEMKSCKKEESESCQELYRQEQAMISVGLYPEQPPAYQDQGESYQQPPAYHQTKEDSCQDAYQDYQENTEGYNTVPSYTDTTMGCSQESYQEPAYPQSLVESCQDSPSVQEQPPILMEEVTVVPESPTKPQATIDIEDILQLIKKQPQPPQIKQEPEFVMLDEYVVTKIEPPDSVESYRIPSPAPSTSRGMKRQRPSTADDCLHGGKQAAYSSSVCTGASSSYTRDDEEQDSMDSSALDLKHRLMRQKNNQASRNSRQNRKQRETEAERQCNELTDRNSHLRSKADMLERLVLEMRAKLMTSVSNARGAEK